MRAWLLSSVSIGVILSSAGLAAGQEAYNWTGFYVGASGGWLNLTEAGEFLDFGTPSTGTHSFGGGFAAARAGYNMQYDQFVFGVEATLGFASATGAQPLGAIDVTTTVQHFGALKVRGGFAFDRFLAFATAGVAASNFAVTQTGPSGLDSNGARLGALVGIGGEYMLTDQISITGEIEVINYGTQTTTIPNYSLSSSATASVGSIGFNFHF